MEDVRSAVEKWRGKRVLVLGDVILDEYLVGRAARLSREAPVPVLEYTQGFFRLGGAANPAHNVVTLGGEASLIGVVGDDDAGDRLRGLLREAGIADALVTVPGRPTTQKTRIVAKGTLIFAQHLARIDRLTREPVPPDAVEGLTGRVSTSLPGADVLLVSDYRGGVMSPELIRFALGKAFGQEIPVVVDAQGALNRYRGATLVKCNRGEAEAELGRVLSGDDDFRNAALSLRESLHAEGVVITRGPEGMTVACGEAIEHLEPANRSEVFDVTGAGDTVVAVLALAAAAKIPIIRGAGLANLAAGMAVRRLGNVAVTVDMLTRGREGE